MAKRTLATCAHNWQQWLDTEFWRCSTCRTQIKRSAALLPYSPEWIARDIEERTNAQNERSNNGLMRMTYGPGPDNATCGDCANFYRLHHHDQTYLKCHLRGFTHGAVTDMRAKWPACGKYTRREPERIAEVYQG